MKVQQLKNKNQYLITDGNKIIFQSYNSTVAIIDREQSTLTLGRHWEYSQTTKKHLALFLDTWLLDCLKDELFNKQRITPDAIRAAIKKGLIAYDENMV